MIIKYMTNEERIEARIESELKSKRYKPHENGEQTVKIKIASAGLTVDEVLDHKWVKDAYSATDGEYTVHVKAESDIHISVV